ncbi:MurR/RpiR family transcriptional regulator [Virgibacillus kekensis]|uniref:MurR/RpiR family transcriptional regulator n=1 Tax=Virgibacillus kekensis TaxID=202261 RepID=A0ABV9DFJ6_9BACI
MSHLKGGLVILKEMIPTLPPSEQKIAKYILQHPEESIMLTALMLGERSDTSSAAVIRLCKSLGFNGFQELKIRVAGDLQEKSEAGYRDIEPNEDFKNIIDKVTSNTIQTLTETINMMNVENLTEAVKAISDARSIVLIGVGGSYIAAKDAEQKFLRIAKHARAYTDIHMAATDIANKGPEDVVIGISFSGKTKEVTGLMELAKQKNIKTIGITKYGKSPVSNNSDILLHTSATKEATFRSGATSSRMAQLHMIDILFMCLASQEYEKIISHLDETREAIAFLKRK